MLGHMAFEYFTLNKHEVITTKERWPSEDFKNFVSNCDVDVIINCIGAIPQRKPKDEYYELVNYDLPVWLDGLGKRVIHPDTDENGDAPYDLSKIKFREYEAKNTKKIRTSILGPEEGTKFSLFEWFMSSEGKVKGYINQLWNGNTTLEWCNWVDKIINNWDSYKDSITISNPDCYSKYQILTFIKDVFDKEIEIEPFEFDIMKNNCLEADFYTKDIIIQLYDLKRFMKVRQDYIESTD